MDDTRRQTPDSAAPIVIVGALSILVLILRAILAFEALLWKEVGNRIYPAIIQPGPT